MFAQLRRSKPTPDWFTRWPNFASLPGTVAVPARSGDVFMYERHDRRGLDGFWIASSPERTGAADIYPEGQLFALAAVDGLERTPGLERGGRARCARLELGEELPRWRAFGPTGRPAVELLDQVLALTPAEAARLASKLGDGQVPRPQSLDVVELKAGGRPDVCIAMERRLAKALFALAPEAALDPYSWGKGKWRWGDPGWQRLFDLAAAAGLARLAPDLLGADIVALSEARWADLLTVPSEST